jgi:uncharacterized protein YllA (UPF0747 family)
MSKRQNQASKQSVARNLLFKLFKTEIHVKAMHQQRGEKERERDKKAKSAKSLDQFQIIHFRL